MTSMQYLSPRRNRQQGNNKTLSYFILLIVVILFLATIGIRLLINTPIFISNLMGGNKITDNRHTDELIANPEIIDIPDATHSARILITIENIKNTNVTVIVNDVIQEEFSSTDPEEEIELELDKGDNAVVVKTKSLKTSEVKKSRTYRVVYLEDAPELEITSPTDGMVTGKEEVAVTGSVSEDISVKVNGSPVVVSGEGTFSYTVKLVNGENKIQVVAQNRAGTTQEKTVTVRYEP